MTSRGGRRVLVGAALAVLAALAGALAVKVVGGLRFQAAEREFRARVGPLDPASYGPPVTDAGLDAARKLAGAAQAIVLPRDRGQGDLLRMREVPAAQWSPEDRARLEAALAENATALNLLREVPRHGLVTLSIAYRQAAQAKLPNLLDAMNAAKLLHLDAVLALQQNDLPRALTDVETLGAMARAYERESALIVVLIGVAIERMQLIAVHEVLSHPSLESEGVGRLQRALPTEDLRAALRRALGMEGASAAHALREGGAEDLQAYGEGAPLGWSALTRVAGDLILARQLQRFQGVASYVGSAAPAVRQFRQQRSDWPNLTASLARFALTDTLRRVAAASLDLRLAGLRSGRYPDALPAAHAAPDIFTGQALRYVRSGEGGAVLEAPGADALFEEFELRGVRPPFRWLLPFPSSGKSPASARAPSPPAR